MTKTFIRNATVITMDDKDRILKNAGVLFEDDVIVAVGPDIDPGPDCDIIDGTDRIVIPGLINGHIHMWQTAVRGFGVDWTGIEHHLHMQTEWVPVYQPEDMFQSEYVGGLSLLNGGVTTVFEWCHGNRTPEHSDAAIAGLERAGIRSLFIHGTVKTLPREGEVHFSQIPHPAEEARRLRRLYSADGGMMSLALGILGPDYSPVEVCEKDFALAAELDVWSSAHYSGRKGKVDRGYFTLAEKGILADKHNAVHGNAMSDDEIRLLIEQGNTITATPTTEVSGGSKAPLVSRVIDAGGMPAIGNDSETATAGSMLSAMRESLAIDRLFRNIKRDAVAKSEAPAATNAVYRGMPVPARKVHGTYEALKWATIGNARSMGLGHRIGSLEPGKQADITIIRANDINLVPSIDPVDAVVAYADSSNVETVFVNGVAKKTGGVLTDASAPTAAAALRERTLRILEESGRAALAEERFA
ncbi:amidohydrolase family protein [Martelella endophytica]|uniref:Amidohydrolase n=1 Tax=Martelella endophytica TaxID=1486262 RepID=A0A0D5LR86_MAREN|nr:amidohydrolase family protein [Martelella endophytica]AJY46282.1 amidohydrolase [Martelella endophytica]